MYCGQSVGWIKVPLGTEVGLGPGDMGTQLPPPPTERGTVTPKYGLQLIRTQAGQPASVNGGLSFVAKRSPISATAELFLPYRRGTSQTCHAERRCLQHVERSTQSSVKRLVCDRDES